MSQFSLPRIYFRGRAVVNAPTGNNQGELCDPANVRLKPKPRAANGSTGQAPTAREQRDQLVRFGESLAYPVYPVAEDSSPEPRDHWNYYGDFRFWFEDVTVRQVVTRERSVLRTRKDDPLIGANVSLVNAIMVDADPLSIFTSQVFAERLLLTNEAVLFAAKPVRHFARWFNAARIRDPLDRLASGAAVFQTKLESEDLKKSPSPILRELSRNGGRTLFLQYTLCNARRQRTAERVADEFLHGRHVTNLCQLDVEGMVSPAEQEDLETTSLARCLLEDDPKRGDRLGPAFVRVDPVGRRLMLDLSSTLSFDRHEMENRRRRHPVRKVALIVPNRLKKEFDGRLSACRDNGGILVRRLNEQDVRTVAANGLEIQVKDAEGELRILREMRILFNSDQRVIYVEKGKWGRLTIEGRSGRSKMPAGLEIDLVVVPSKMSRPSDSNQKAGRERIVTLSGRGVRRVGNDRYTAKLEGNKVNVDVHGVRPGAVQILFGRRKGMLEKIEAMAESPLPPFDDAFTTVRVLPSYRVPKVGAKFGAINNEILRYYDVVFPYMTDRHFQFEEADLRTNARQILARLNLSPDDPNYMPPSRDMSDGKKKVLIRYLEALLNAPPEVR